MADDKRPGERRYTTLLLLTLGIGVVDLIWSREVGLVFVGWMQPAIAVVLCASVSMLYSRLRPVPPLAELSSCAAVWIGFTAIGCTLTYLAASVSRPLVDPALSAFDISLGFDWTAWTNYVHRDALLATVLRLAYGSLAVQIMGSVLFLALRGFSGRNEELLMHAMLALLVTALISAVWPAFGPWVQLSYPDALPGNTLYIPDLLILRHGGTATFALSQMQGVVSFPSYHTVLAILLIHAHRASRWSLPPILVVNGLMLLAIPSEGDHYLADMLAGAGVAAAAIATERLVFHRQALWVYSVQATVAVFHGRRAARCAARRLQDAGA